MEKIVDLIATDASPADTTDQIKDLLYTKVTSFYGHHKIISIISHEICKGTVEANRWTLRAFTLKTASFQQLARRQRIPMLLQLHFQ